MAKYLPARPFAQPIDIGRFQNLHRRWVKRKPQHGIASRAFSVSPFTRAHIVEPRSVLSVPVPETYTKLMAGSSRNSALEFAASIEGRCFVSK